MRPMRMRTLFRAIVIGLAPACDEDRVVPPVDASSTDVALDTTLDASADVAIDSYVDWCDSGPPELIGGDGCNTYEYIPCGLPSEDTVDDAGVINRCDQFCTGAPDDQCAEVPPVWYEILIDGGELDASSLTDGGVLVLCACTGSSGRRPAGLRKARAIGTTAAGAYLAHVACLEAASVHAFARLRDEVAMLFAPRELLAEIDRAALDETRHARVVSRAARAHGGLTHEPHVNRGRARRSITAIACENMREGCMRETFGALVATWQAEHAETPRMRAMMRSIARDETTHAELSMRVAAFLESKLDRKGRARVRKTRREVRRALERETFRVTSRDVARTLGLPSPRIARSMLRALDGALWPDCALRSRA